MATMVVKDANDVNQTVEKPNANGRVAAASSRPVVLSTEDLAVLNDILAAAVATGSAGTPAAEVITVQGANSMRPVDVQGTVSITDISAAEYETIAAGQTAQTIGPTGATGDYISGLLVIPASTSPGNVILLDNATSMTVFTGGASSVTNLVPFFIPLGMKSVSGAWKVTTGSNVSVIAVGNFT